VELADAFFDVGDLDRCAASATAALELAGTTGDRRVVARARAVRLRLTFSSWEGDSGIASLNAVATALLDELEDLGDEEGMTDVLLVLGLINNNHFERSSAYFERALALAERTGSKAAAFAAGTLGLILVYGPVPAEEAIERCRALRGRVADHRLSAATMLRHEAVLLAMQGRMADMRTVFDEYKRIVDDLGNPWAMANLVFGEWQIEMLAGRPDRAEAAARASLDILEAMGAKNEGSTAAALLAVALARQGRHDEAIRYADLAASWAAPDDIASQVGQLSARAHVLAARDNLPGALTAVREAVRASEGSDDISQRGDTLVDLATILVQAGQADQALTALHDAIALYDRKGNVVGAERAQAMLRRLGARASVADA
jgi:tetratricopeptide (TPR) repeat protein